MKTAMRPDNISELEQFLEGHLQLELSQIFPVQIRCLFKDETLVILAQSLTDAKLNPKKVFRFLEQSIRGENIKHCHRVLMYLTEQGQKQHQDFHTFTLERSPQAPQSPPPTPSTEPPLNDISLPTPDFSAAAASSSAADFDQESDFSAPDVDFSLEEPIASAPNFAEEDSLPETPEPSQEDLSPETPEPSQRNIKHLIPALVVGAGLGVMVFATSLYVLTRPCVLGTCTTLSQAEQLSQRSAQTLQNPQSGKAILEAQQQLNEAIKRLESIPFWSSYYEDAQARLKDYYPRAESTDEIVDALQKAARVSYQSQNPPHPASKWVEIQQQWREVIAQLEQIPTSSSIYPLAQQKIKAYQANLLTINQRLAIEKQVQGHLNAAKEAARIAEARQGVAQSLQNWQLVYATWQSALNRLKQIPQGTTSSREAQQLIALYQPKLAEARDRRAQEQFASRAYNQGLRLAQRAQTSQKNQQWSTAVKHWQDALTYINQVPSGTFYYGKAQALNNSYNTALKQAQAGLQLAIRLQQARLDLAQTCSANTQVCNYTISNNVIQVKLTPTYMQMVKQRALVAKARGDSNSQVGIVNHILTLGEALEAISENSRMRLEVYSAEGTLVEVHTPKVRS
ncbi:MAG: hypothetical protein KME06_21700 [Kastovskya adunca ATA6-11-RM4]|nr:hypothetical protein [Kastovskya adunca ATA6-11-RM4]